ncbi:MAG: hypothetical protein MJA83_04920 [Gammaproteobacteria bacterium]|nr:hypothetical protein [Gammaproteobacteria bacterium]
MTKGTKPTASKRTKRSLRKKNRPDFPPSFIYRPKYTSANKQKKIINPSGARPILDPANLAQESPEQRHKRIIEEANRVIRASKIEYKEKWITPSPEVKREVFKPIQQDNYIFASWNIKQISKSGWSRNLKNGLSTNGVSTRNHYIVSTIEAMECDIINIIEPRPDDAEIIKNNAVTELNKLKCFLGTPWVGIAAREDNLSMFYTECFSVPSGMYDSHILLYKTPLSPLGHAPISQDLDGIFRPVFDIESAKLRYLPNEPNQVKMPDEPQ